MGYTQVQKRGAVIIRYAIPREVRNATITVYALNGSCLKTFALRPDTDRIVWDIGRQNIGTGVYIALLHAGNVKKNIKMAIVK